MSLAGGLGAVNAFQDAVVLANYLHSLPSTDTWKQNDVTQAFKGYKAERYSSAKHACEMGHSIGHLTGKVNFGLLTESDTSTENQYLSRNKDYFFC